MLKQCLLATSVFAASAIAQCTTIPPATNLATIVPFSGSHYLGHGTIPANFVGYGTVFDMTTTAAITVSKIDINLYDDGAVNPSQIGNTANVHVWTFQNTWTGNLVPATIPTPQNPPPGGTYAGLGTLTVGAADAHSPVVFATPIVFPAGTVGVVIQVENPTAGTNPGPLHQLLTLQSAVPSTPLTASDQYITIFNQGIQRHAWITPPNAAGITVCADLHYTPDPSSAHWQSYGAGCYFRPQMFYEHFAAPTNIDLQNTSITMLPTGPNYTVVPGPSSILPPSGTATQLSASAYTSSTTTSWDDALVTVNLPWAFPYAGGSATSISVGSNGQIFLGTSVFAYGYYSQINALRNEGMPSINGCYGDWDLSLVTGSEGLWFEVVGTKAYFTWVNVPEWVPANNAPHTNNFQVVLDQSGQIEFHYGNVAASAAEVLVGYCQGSGVQDPGSQDLSATMPFASGDGSVPSVQVLTARPVLGTTVSLRCINLQAGTFFSFQVVGFLSVPGGIDLGFLGMPGCKQWITAIVVTNLAPVILGVADTTLTLPADPALVGVQLHAQSAPLTSGLNAAGILTSSAACAVLNMQ